MSDQTIKYSSYGSTLVSSTKKGESQEKDNRKLTDLYSYLISSFERVVVVYVRQLLVVPFLSPFLKFWTKWLVHVKVNTFIRLCRRTIHYARMGSVTDSCYTIRKYPSLGLIKSYNTEYWSDLFIDDIRIQNSTRVFGSSITCRYDTYVT